MQGSRWDVEHIACRHRDARQKRFDLSTTCQRCADLLVAHRRISAEQEVRPRRRVEDHPRLVFSDRVRAVQLGGERIVWVHLHRESLLDIEQLDERTLIGDLAEPCFADRLS